MENFRHKPNDTMRDTEQAILYKGRVCIVQEIGHPESVDIRVSDAGKSQFLEEGYNHVEVLFFFNQSEETIVEVDS